jgi:pyruvate kinase
MLSDETANGKYPLEAVEVMKRVIMYSQSHAPIKVVYPAKQEAEAVSRQLAMSRSIISLASSIHANAIVAETKSGATALQIAAERPDTPLIAVTDTARTAQQLAIVYDIKSFVRPVSKQAAQRLAEFLRSEQVFKKGDIVVMVSGQYPGVVGTTDTIKVRQLD